MTGVVLLPHARRPELKVQAAVPKEGQKKGHHARRGADTHQRSSEGPRRETAPVD